MAAIDREPLETPGGSAGAALLWRPFARRVADWSAARGVDPRDAIVLLPFAQLLAAARAAFADLASWLPRIETTQTLAASLGPAARAEAMQLGLDLPTDLLAAQRLLAAQSWARETWGSDPRAMAHAAAALVDTAHGLWRAASAVAPMQRDAYWGRARALLGPLEGPGAAERRLARVALEWAALGIVPLTDRLFGLRPGAWIVLQAGGADPLASALLEAAASDTPCLLLDADPAPAELWPAGSDRAAPALAVCAGFEDEAQCAAAQVITHLQRGEQPVVLIAQDRVLVRRIRALLERSGATLADETGWTLSTTRAAGRVMALLRAAAAGAGSDALFDWLKAVDAWPGGHDTPGRVAALEAACRQAQLARVEQIASLRLEPRLAAFRDQVLGLLGRYARPGAAEPGRWLDRLFAALADCGSLETLQADDAGRQVLAALCLDVAPADRPAGLQSGAADPLDAPAFAAWVDAVLEHAIYRPAASRRGATAQVIVTPLAQALLRPCAAIVLPGADDAQFGAPPAPHPLLGEGLLRELGLPDAAQRRSAETTALACAVRAAPLTLLRRRLDQREPRGDSPLVELLRLELERDGRALGIWSDPRPQTVPAATPQTRPAPSAADLLPARLSASAAEALRACPYRWFALNLLGLDEANELEGEVGKRDYGTWLHAVLQRFHAERGAPAERAAEVGHLAAIGRTVQAEQGFDDAAFLAYAASFEVFAPRYIEWLHARDAAGAAWRESEADREIALPGAPGTVLRGRIDRIDVVPGEAGRTLELIDYKTGSTQALSERVRQPFEDTQLAAYAALVATEGRPMKAIYLAVDGTRELGEIEHPQVGRSGAALAQGLAEDLRRVHAGAGLPALGEGPACAYCAARGLCRRDHWSPEVAL